MKMNSNRRRYWTAMCAMACIMMGGVIKCHAVDMSSLSINGYASFEYEYQLTSEGNGDPNGSFDSDLIDLVFGFRPTDQVRVALDVSWEHGSATEDGIGNVALEYGFVEYAVRDELRIRAGKLFVPFGYFNEIHTAKPAYLSVKEAPSMNKSERIVDDAFRYYPRWGVGVALQGDCVVSDLEFDYDIFVHNGDQENTNPYEEDDNKAKAVAARVRVALAPWLTVGNSLYWDNKITTVDTEIDQITGAETVNVTDSSLIADGIMVIMEFDKFRILAEAGIGRLDARDGDSRTQISGYVQPSYRFSSGLTPYARYEYVDPSIDVSDNSGSLWTLGINCPITSAINLKLEDNHFIGDSGSSLGEFSGNGYNEIKAAIAVAF